MPDAGRGLGGVAAKKLAGGSTLARPRQPDRGSQRHQSVLVGCTRLERFMDVLPQTRIRKVCIPVLTGQLHQGLIAHGGLDQ